MQIIEFQPISDQGSIVIFEGIDQATGDHVTFGVDHRPAAEILELVAADEVESLSVEDWQVLSRIRPRTITDEHFELYQQNGTWCGD